MFSIILHYIYIYIYMYYNCSDARRRGQRREGGRAEAL